MKGNPQRVIQFMLQHLVDALSKRNVGVIMITYKVKLFKFGLDCIFEPNSIIKLQ